VNAKELVDHLFSLPVTQWRPNPGTGDAALVDSVEQLADRQMPNEWREIYKRSNGGAVRGRRSTLNFMILNDVVELNSQDDVLERLPGMVGIGDDAGGAIYYIDPKNELAQGVNAVFWIQLGVLTLEDSRLVAGSLAAAIERVLAGHTVADSASVRELRKRA
jgi:hypothetical protein